MKEGPYTPEPSAGHSIRLVDDWQDQQANRTMFYTYCGDCDWVGAPRISLSAAVQDGKNHNRDLRRAQALASINQVNTDNNQKDKDMDFSKVEIKTDVAPPKRSGRQATDLTPLFDAARANEGNWISIEGTSSLNTYRTQIMSGTPEGCERGDFEVRVKETQAPVAEEMDDDGNVTTEAVPGMYELYIKTNNAEEKAAAIARYEARKAAAAERAAQAEGTSEAAAPANPLG